MGHIADMQIHFDLLPKSQKLQSANLVLHMLGEKICKTNTLWLFSGFENHRGWILEALRDPQSLSLLTHSPWYFNCLYKELEVVAVRGTRLQTWLHQTPMAVPAPGAQCPGQEGPGRHTGLHVAQGCTRCLLHLQKQKNKREFGSFCSKPWNWFWGSLLRGEGDTESFKWQEEETNRKGKHQSHI